jgi:hypothetical protein
MTTRCPTRADLTLVRADTGKQQRGEFRVRRRLLVANGPCFGNQSRDQLRSGQQCQDKAVAAEDFPETASSVDEARVAKT